MANGHAEKMSLSTSERISLGKGKRGTAQPIGKSSDRDFDWQSVPTPDLRRDENEPRDDGFNGKGFTPAALFERPNAPAAHPLDRVFGQSRRAGEFSAVVGESGSLTVHGVEKSFVGRKVVKGVSLSLRRGEAVGLLGPN